MNLFSQYARYYDLLYKDKDYVAEANYVAKSLDHFFPGAKYILEFGSGTGIHGRLLAQKGYCITGIERSPEMVAAANESVMMDDKITPGSFTTRLGDIQNTKLQEKFDAVIALFHVISYQTRNEELVATFKNAAYHLKENGIFLFDVWYTPAVLTQRPGVRVKRMEDENLKLERVAEPVTHPNEDVVDVCYTIYIEEKSNHAISRLTEVHPMRHLSLPELELIAHQTGFAPIHNGEFLTGKVPGEDTWGVFCVWRRI